MKIYIVTSGSYSDYGINCVFSTKEKADEYVKMKNLSDRWEDYNVEEYDVDKPYEMEAIDFYYVPKTNIVYSANEFAHRYGRCLYKTYNSFISFSEVQEEWKDRYFGVHDYEQLDLIETELSEGVFLVKVSYSPDINIIKKVVYDQVAKMKAEMENL